MFLVFAATVMTPVSSAKADIYETLWNFDVRNNTGQTANDFELTFGVNPGQISGIYTQPPGLVQGYPNANVQGIAGGSLITWTGSTTAPGDWAHFGVAWAPPPFNPDNPTFTWTSDGEPIGAATMIFGHWTTVDYNMPVFHLDNPWVDPEWVVIGIYAALGPSPELDDLVVGGQEWTDATWLEPMRLDVGDVWNFNFLDDFPELAGQEASYSVIVQKFGDNGGVIGDEEAISFMEVDVPEPSAMALTGVGLAGLALSVYRRRSK